MAFLNSFRDLQRLQCPFAQVVILLQVYTSVLAALTVGLLGFQSRLQTVAEVKFIDTQSAASCSQAMKFLPFFPAFPLQQAQQASCSVSR